MRTRVGLIELAGHNEVLWAYCEILVSMDIDVVIFCSSFVKEQLWDLATNRFITWEVLDVKSKDFDFGRIREVMESSDFLIFTTVLPRDYSWIKNLNLMTRKAIVIHDAHYYFDPRSNRFFRTGCKNKILDILRWIKFTVFFHKKRRFNFLNYFDFWVFPSHEVLLNVRKQFKSQLSKPTAAINFAVPGKTQKEYFSEAQINIVIPGSISEKSRNYFPVINAIQLALPQLSKNVRIMILGKPIRKYGIRILKEFAGLQNEFLKVTCFNKFIDQKEFDLYMRKANFLILPINPIMETIPIREKNGFSCVSGNINDMIKYNKPALIPSFYLLPESMEDQVQRYRNSEHLAELLITWINNPKRYQEKRGSKYVKDGRRAISQEVGKLLYD